MYREKKFYVYIATNFPRKTVLYTGISNSLIRRGFEHAEKTHSGSFTAHYNVNRIVYYEIFNEPNAAIAREKQMKNLLRRKKIALIEQQNPEWKGVMDLYD